MSVAVAVVPATQPVTKPGSHGRDGSPVDGGSRDGAFLYPLRPRTRARPVVTAGRRDRRTWPARADVSPDGRSVAAAVIPATASTTNLPAPGWHRVPTGRPPRSPRSATTAEPGP